MLSAATQKVNRMSKPKFHVHVVMDSLLGRVLGVFAKRKDAERFRLKYCVNAFIMERDRVDVFHMSVNGIPKLGDRGSSLF